MFRLVYSMILYLAGIAAVLYIRPSFMFKGNGQWKEFAIRNGESTTVFPFWMFCISWALVSYILVQVIGNYLAPSTALAFATASASAIASEEPEETRKPSKSKSNVATSTPHIRGLETQEEENEDAIMPLSPMRSKKNKQVKESKESKEKVVEVMKPGYYKMDPTSTNSKGVPRYIYMGAEAPSAESSDSDS